MKISKGYVPPESIFLKAFKCEYEGRPLLSYTIGLARIRILLLNDNRLVYCVDEPQLQDQDLEIVQEIVKKIIVTGLETLPTSVNELKKLVISAGVPYVKVAKKLAIFKYFVDKAVSGYGPLYPLMRDPEVEEIAVDAPNKPVSVLHRRIPYGWIDTNIVLNEVELDTLVMYLARRVGKPVSIAHPYAEGLTPEGHRVALTFAKEVSRAGSSIVVRKHFEKPLPITALIQENMLTEIAAAYLWLVLEYGGSVLIVGPTASGKTTLLQALLGLIPSTKRIVTIEDTPELNLFDRPHWDSLVARRSYSKDLEDIDLDKLAIFALRRRPDILVIGEIRGREVHVFFQAAATGHAALATFHADSAHTALDRLKAMGVEDYLIDGLWVIVTLRRIVTQDGIIRRVIEIAEVVDRKPLTVFRWDPREDILKPTAVNELLHRTRRLWNAVEIIGKTSEDLRFELEMRAQLLKRLREEGVFEFKEVYRRIDELLTRQYIGRLYAKTTAKINSIP